MFSEEVFRYIDKSILCWLATASADAIPNVSPKEIFAAYSDDCIIIANIASPQSVKNILDNENVCVSFIDVLVQKGYQLKGKAQIIKSGDDEYSAFEEIILKMTLGKYPFNSIIKIKVNKIKKILAPSYLLYPDTSEQQQIVIAKKAYNLDYD